MDEGAELRNTAASATRILSIYGKLINYGMIRSYADVHWNGTHGYLEPRIYGELVNY